jgi:hypothetical protein
MLPYSLDLLSDCLPGIDVPTDPFDPKGEWECNYAVWNPARAKDAKSELLGSLLIRRRRPAGGNIRLQLTQVIKMNGLNGSGITKASVTCAADDLSTPIRWKIDSEVVDPKGKQVALTATSISGEASRGSITLHGEKDARIKASEKLSSNWSLLDAVQRLSFDSKALEFDMLEELELLKPEQRLSPGPTAEVELGARMTKLHSFEHIGRGILPVTYWLDDEHRLLIAVGGRRAFLLDSKAGGPE